MDYKPTWIEYDMHWIVFWILCHDTKMTLNLHCVHSFAATLGALSYDHVELLTWQLDNRLRALN